MRTFDNFANAGDVKLKHRIEAKNIRSLAFKSSDNSFMFSTHFKVSYK